MQSETGACLAYTRSIKGGLGNWESKGGKSRRLNLKGSLGWGWGWGRYRHVGLRKDFGFHCEWHGKPLKDFEWGRGGGHDLTFLNELHLEAGLKIQYRRKGWKLLQ